VMTANVSRNGMFQSLFLAWLDLLLLLNDRRYLPELIGEIKAVSRHPPEGIGSVRVNTSLGYP
jgi:hypothetical protein